MKDITRRRLTQIIPLERQLNENSYEFNSTIIGEYLETTGDSIRRDLHELNPGKKKKRYKGRSLEDEIRTALDIKNPDRYCLVGLEPMGLYMLDLIQDWDLGVLEVIFDTKVNRLERLNLEIPTYPSWEIDDVLHQRKVETAILTTKPEEAEKNTLRLQQGGIKGLLNLSGHYLNPLEWDLKIHNINLIAELLFLRTKQSH